MSDYGPRMPTPDGNLGGSVSDDEYTLEEAIMQMNVNLATRLLSEGASANDTDSEGVTALMRAVETEHAPMVRLLLRKGAKVNAADDDGLTALHRSIDGGISRILLDNGAYVNKRDKSGKAALHHAVDELEEDVVEVLLKRGANPDLKDHKGRTARRMAKQNGYKSILRLIESYDD